MSKQMDAVTGMVAKPVTATGEPYEQRGLMPPHPPDDDEKYLYIRRNLPYLATVILIGSCCLIGSQLSFELH
ncbi:hypothetical protein, partial [Trebonia sp.]